ncbi:YHYH domain-containing protein [Lichenibacterium dinghuense]|uniref:YHYH domain-containing protein n=1 Tax=Lichenibacterium dinghuense TaxID=2895977 RepID=UPI003D175326
MRFPCLITISMLVLALLLITADAHPGALDANGCHRVRKTGRRICHAGHIRPGEHRRYVGFDGAVRHYSH